MPNDVVVIVTAYNEASTKAGDYLADWKEALDLATDKYTGDHGPDLVDLTSDLMLGAASSAVVWASVDKLSKAAASWGRKI